VNPGYDVPVSTENPRAAATTRVIRLHEDDGAFDREFWRGVPPSRRLELTWEMVLEYI